MGACSFQDQMHIFIRFKLKCMLPTADDVILLFGHRSINLLFNESMDLIYYSFMPLTLFRVPYMLDFLPYYLSIANGAGGVGILNFLYFNVLYRSYRVNNKVIDVLCILMYCYTRILFVGLRKGWVSYKSVFAGNLP